MKKVITYGSFDLFHDGHYRLLERAKALGDYLIVGVTTEQYDEYRGKLNVVDSLSTRIDNVRKTGFANEIIIEDHAGQKTEDIQKHNIDIFTVGSDWNGKFEYLRKYCDVIYLERTKGISSTVLRTHHSRIIRLGVIGTGRIAKRFIPEVKFVSGINVEAVYNPNGAHADLFANQFEINISTDDLDLFWNSIDAVYIATPHDSHYTYAKTALEHNIHVLCEKPMALKKTHAEELFALAERQGLVLAEAIKTAYCPGFNKLVSIASTGQTGRICEVTACFTKLVPPGGRETDPEQFGGSFTELASYPLLGITKILGTDYKDVKFDRFVDKSGIDLYVIARIYYSDATATARIGLGVKSEGEMVLAGTNGYLYVPAPWWKTKDFELRFEDASQNERFFYKFLGEGFRYEISAFVSAINGSSKKEHLLTKRDSIWIAEMMELFLSNQPDRTKTFLL